MTEAMSRHEIEDVLSSIRRLVSHEDRPAQPTPSASGKLVLTSALRVDTPAEPGESAAPESAPAPFDPVPSSMTVSPAAPEPMPGTEHPRFADAPLRAPLLTRIAQAGQVPEAGAATADEPIASARTEPSDTASDSSPDNPLEATLARLEEVLAIAPVDTPAAEDRVIDEDALAEMVARIVRQELQGELGERITRNIRKLVRAEVARELQMRNL